VTHGSDIERIVRLETQHKGFAKDLSEIKAALLQFPEDNRRRSERLHEKIEEGHAAIADSVKAISDNQIAFTNQMKGRVWGLRAVWVALSGVMVALGKLVMDQQTGTH